MLSFKSKYMSVINTVKKNYYNALGDNVSKKIVVFESDDWGTIRSCTREKLTLFESRFNGFSEHPYLKYDTLANSNDLSALMDVLFKFRDVHGNNPIITFNTVVTNPDFDKIKSSGFKEYHNETFTNTLLKFYPNESVFDVWKKGIEAGFFYPQFHGREHVNVPVWLDLLKSGNQDIIDAFEFQTWSTPKGFYPPSNVKLQAALDYSGNQPFEHQIEFLKEGLNLFKDIFGFESKTWIPNNFIVSSDLIRRSSDFGIEAMQGMIYHVEPKGESPKNKNSYKLRRFGRDAHGMIHFVRNCSFEPAQSRLAELEVKNCIADIRNAFFWNKPAVISVHRLNFIGALDESNRSRNLLLLGLLLTTVLKNWPDVQFMNSEQLLNAYKS